MNYRGTPKRDGYWKGWEKSGIGFLEICLFDRMKLGVCMFLERCISEIKYFE